MTIEQDNQSRHTFDGLEQSDVSDSCGWLGRITEPYKGSNDCSAQSFTLEVDFLEKNACSRLMRTQNNGYVDGYVEADVIADNGTPV